MRIRVIIKSVTAAFLFFLSGTVNGYASEGQVSITGKLVTVGCTLVDGIENFNVPLEPIALNALPRSGSVAGKVSFTIGLNCYTGTKVSIKLTSSSKDSFGNGVLSNSAGEGLSTGIGIQVMDSSGAPVVFDKPFVIVNSAIKNINPLRFFAQYIRTHDAASAGEIKATADFTLSYD
ncbi:fimbrial protein [Pseudescherichia sp.]|uniref:fimbrial protein n=1 Tax=Pseudescherichia sp. TaxID=2055881 RepID=UPI0028968365|nr:fimbrial protein [Pseudescherichia sp.]